MPITKKPANVAAEAAPTESKISGRCQGKCEHHKDDDFGRRILLTIFGVLLVYVTFYVGTLMRNEIKKYSFIGQADVSERMITVNGTAKVNGKNDIAVTTIGFSNSDPSVAKAQQENKKVMDQVMSDLKNMGIEDKDMLSDYTISPEYDYTQKGSVFKGYRVTNNVQVKIRNLNLISDVLSLAGKYGANQVGGLSFTIDDPENLKNEARAKALADARQKAAQLGKQLGVIVGEIISYNDFEAVPYAQNYSMKTMNQVADGRGGGPEVVSSGSQDVEMNVSVTYKIYPR